MGAWTVYADAMALKKRGKYRYGDGLYVGCRCPACGLTGVYGDWKNEHEDHVALLARV